MNFDSLKYRYRASSPLMRLIWVNIALWLILRVMGLLSVMITGNSLTLVQWVELPSSLSLLMLRPWTVVTYMFCHYDLLHILFNMLWLYWLGRIFVEFFSNRQLVGLYLMGGLAGAVLFVLAYALLPQLQGQRAFLIGASAAVMAIVVAIAVYRPDYPVGLLFIGTVGIKWIAIATVVIDLLSIDDGNFGGHIAHIGGMLMGLWFALAIRRGTDITAWLNRAVFSFQLSLGRKRSGKRGPGDPIRGGNFHYHESTPADTKPDSAALDERRLDEILKKLKQSGYAALSDEEKEFLFNASSKR